jgi:hypothetical protein
MSEPADGAPPPYYRWPTSISWSPPLPSPYHHDIIRVGVPDEANTGWFPGWRVPVLFSYYVLMTTENTQIPP